MIIDKLLSAHTIPTAVLKIERLELDLGQVSMHQLEKALVNKIEAALELQLPEVLRHAAARHQEEARSGSDTDLVVYYLQQGLLPWWAGASTYKALEKALQHMLQGDAARNRKLFGALFQQDLVLQRFLYTFPHKIRNAVAALYAPKAGAAMKALESGLFTLFAGKVSAREFSLLYGWCLLAPGARAERPGDYVVETAMQVFAVLGHHHRHDTDLFKWGQDYLKLVTLLKKVLARYPAFYPGLEQAGKYAREMQYLLASPDKQATGGARAAQAARKKVEKQLGEIRSSLQAQSGKAGPQTLVPHFFPAAAREESQAGKPGDLFSDTNKLYIENAGLVLLWPFLGRFFHNLALADDKQLVGPGAAEEACLLLQYLTAGSSEAVFEAQLPLNKVLCGLGLQQPVNTRLPIPAAKKQAGAHFLRAVIRHGPLWKGLSLGSFRQAYLQREGALSIRDGNWLLQVKRQTYDVIIDKLPWSVQVVKLPWMRRLIFVEWQL